MKQLFRVEGFEDSQNSFDCPMCSARFHAGFGGFDLSEIGGSRGFRLCDSCGLDFLSIADLEIQNGLFEDYLEEIG